MNVPNRLYHYCSVENFFKIVESKSIWLSNVKQMNDKAESKWVERYFEIIRENFSGDYYTEFIREVFNTYNWLSSPSYVFCLSANKDLLSQWRAYADDGHGVCVGFTTKDIPFNHGPTVAFGEHESASLGLSKVVYFNHSQKKLILEQCQKLKEGFDGTNDFWYPRYLGYIISYYATIFKNPSFKEEREWRLIYTPNPNGKFKFPMSQISEVKFRTQARLIRKYCSFDFNDQLNSSLIDAVVIGPKCLMVEDEIADFLKSNNMGETRVMKSKSSYG